MNTSKVWWLLIPLTLWSAGAAGQATLGELLDAGGKPLSPAEFKEQVVHRMIEGPTPTGGRIELMYASNGTVQGVGAQSAVAATVAPWTAIAGEWKVGDDGRICAAIRGAGTANLGGGGGTTILPMRCHFWFKLGKDYYFADSDTDRSAKVLSRTVKQP